MTGLSTETVRAAMRRPPVLETVLAAQRRFPWLQLLVTVAAFVVGALTLDGFGSVGSITTVLVLAALVGFAAIGQTLTVLIGGIDFSVASFLVVGALFVTQLRTSLGLPFGVALLLLVPFTLLLGGFVGWLCHRFQIEPLVATLAMGSIALGLTQLPTGGAIGGGAPEWLMQLASVRATTLGLPVPPILVLWVVVIVAMAIVLHRTPVGRRLQAAGANPRAAGYALIRVRRVWVAVFGLSALFAALAGVVLAAFTGSVTTAVGAPYLFQALAAVIIGGTAFGGPGDYTRTAVGALMLTVISTVLVGHGLATSDQQILSGVVILVAMVLYGRGRRLGDRI